MNREQREVAQAVCEPEITNLARALYEVGLHSVGPDDLDNRQIAQRLLAGGYVQVGRRLSLLARIRRALTKPPDGPVR